MHVMKGQIIVMLTFTLFGGWALPMSALAQHEWDNFSIGECLIVNLSDTTPRFDTTPELIQGLDYTCIAQGSSGLLTNPRTGQLQFINGYNHEFEPMEGDGGYGGGGQNGGACPLPGDDSGWLIIGKGSGGAGYTRINMQLDSGLGAVTASRIDFTATSPSTNGSALVPHSDGYHYWFITPGKYHLDSLHQQNIVTEFNSYLIGPDGPILPPVVSEVPVSLGAFYYGSPDGSTVVTFAQYDSIRNQLGLGIFHVDQKTGKITLLHIIQQGQYFQKYAFMPWAFSPDSKVLYSTTQRENDSNWYLLQYDLTRLDASDAPYIVAKSDSGFGPEMALAGNGRIYGVSNYSKLDKQGFPIGYWFGIYSPDSLGAACHFVDTAFSSGRTGGLGIYNGVPRVVHSTLAQIQAISLQSCQSSCYSFSRSDTGGFPHWTFEGGSPATSIGPTVPEVCFDSAGPHEVFAVLSSGDTLMDLVAGGVPAGTSIALNATNAVVQSGGTVTVPISLKLGYSNGLPNAADWTIDLLQEYVLTFDTNILMPNPATISISDNVYEVSYARQIGNTLTIMAADTGGYKGHTGTWPDTTDTVSIRFDVTKSNNWRSTLVKLARFSMYDGIDTRYDFCPEENDLLATVTNANAGVSQLPATPNFTLYPNPTTGVVTVAGLSGPVQVENVLGESVMRDVSGETRNGEVTIDLSAEPAGTYFLHIQTPGGEVVRRIVKK